MNYTENPKLDANATVEVKEPVTAYYTGRIGNAFAEPWDENDGEPLTPEEKAAIRRNPEFIAWEQEVIGKLLDGRAATLAGKTRPFNEAVNDILRDVEDDENIVSVERIIHGTRNWESILLGEKW